MKIEEHEKAYEEHLNNIEKFIENGVEDNQRNVGYNISQGSVELFSILMHKLNLIEGSGDQFDHRVFKNKNLIEKKIPLEFKNRTKILNLMKDIELSRNVLCYGTRKLLKKIEETIKNFNELRKTINSMIKK